jgi:hypothetical protein
MSVEVEGMSEVRDYGVNQGLRWFAGNRAAYLGLFW